MSGGFGVLDAALIVGLLAGCGYLLGYAFGRWRERKEAEGQAAARKAHDDDTATRAAAAAADAAERGRHMAAHGWSDVAAMYGRRYADAPPVEPERMSGGSVQGA